MEKLKILFITGAGGVDYLNDLVFIGLVNNGHEVLDSKFLWYTEDITAEQHNQVYGRGFTISNNLSGRSSINRDEKEIIEKIKTHYFDCIIYGSIWRCNDYYDIVKDCYKNNEIIILDGEDTTKDLQLTYSKGIYFKRELLDYQTKCLPISFSIPTAKMVKNIEEIIMGKNRFMSFITPKNIRTYIYAEELPYYEDYRHSLFGTTTIKAGADCLRHYEIIGNGCLPYFTDIKNVAKMTMVNWPMDLQVEANIMAENFNEEKKQQYVRLLRDFFYYAKNNLTSEVVAENMLKKIF